jgi:hypothetical protein
MKEGRHRDESEASRRWSSESQQRPISPLNWDRAPHGHDDNAGTITARPHQTHEAKQNTTPQPRRRLKNNRPTNLPHLIHRRIGQESHRLPFRIRGAPRRQNQTTGARRVQTHRGGSEHASSGQPGSRSKFKIMIHTPPSILRPRSLIPNMSPTVQKTPQVTEPFQATRPKPAVAPPLTKPKRSLGDDEDDDTGGKAAGKAQKDNNSSTMEGVEITKEPDPSGDATTKDGVNDEAPTTSGKGEADKEEDELSSEEENGDDWARKAEEATKIAKAKASKSPLAKRWDKKNAGLQAFGFSNTKTRSAPAERADSSSNAPPREQLLLRGQFPFQMYCYITMDLQGGDDGIKTTVAVAEKTRSLLTLLSSTLPGCALVPLSKMSKEVVWTKASQVPNQRFSEIQKKMAFTVDLESLLKRVPRNKSKQLSGVVLLGALKELSDADLVPLRIDLADQHGIFLEKKQLQVEHSIKNISFPMLPPQTDLEYVGAEVERTLNMVLEEYHKRVTSKGASRGSFVIPYDHVTILVKVCFPENTFQKFKKGEKPSYDSDNKRQVHMEYPAALEGAILAVLKPWKQELRKTLGRKTYPLVIPPKDMKKSKLKNFLFLCNTHIASLECLSAVELGGCLEVDKKISCKLSGGARGPSISVRDLLMEYKTNDGLWVFQMIAPSDIGTHEATFANTSEREALASNVAKHLATWVMMRLYMYHGVEIDDCASFLNYTFEKTSATIAQKFGDFDDDGTIRLQEGALTQDQMDDDIAAEMAAETWIDMNVLNSAGPEVARGDRTNGILFDHDATKSLGSMDTKGLEDHLHGEVSEEFFQRNGGIAGLQDRNSEKPRATDDSAETGGSSSPGQQEGENE